MTKRLLSFMLLVFTGLLCGVDTYYVNKAYDINRYEIDKTIQPTPEIGLIISDEHYYTYDNNIEIYSIEKDYVVKSVQLTLDTRNMLIDWIVKTDSIYVKATPLSDKGYIIKVPFNPPVVLNGKWVNGFIQEIYIMLTQQCSPFFIVFEEDGHMTCYVFKGDINQLSKALDFDFGG